MNYYEHHLRDYEADTAHLTWDQDMAYTRLIRWYYRKERPIPSDIKEACRLMRASSKAQRDAVANVLDEFFELRDDGWHHHTCDDVIAAFRSGEPEREAKKKNEETRLARHRKERSELFSIINAAGFHLPWNAPIKEVRELAERISKASVIEHETHAATAPETAPATPATATQTPDTRHQYTNTQVVGNQPLIGDADADNATRVGAICKKLRQIGIDAAPHLPAWPDLLERFTDEQIIAVAEIAKERKPNERIHLNYLVPILNEPPKAPSAGAKRAPSVENFEGREYGHGGRL